MCLFRNCSEQKYLLVGYMYAQPLLTLGEGGEIILHLILFQPTIRLLYFHIFLGTYMYMYMYQYISVFINKICMVKRTGTFKCTLALPFRIS